MSSVNIFVQHKKNFDHSSVWYHFLTAVDSRTAKCKRCPAILKTLGGSTKGLHTHLLSKHNIKVSNETNFPSTSQGCTKSTATLPSKRKLIDYIPARENLDEILARMTSLDGFTFNTFKKSRDLRELLIAKSFTDLPSSTESIQKLVMNYSYRIREEVIAEIAQLKSSGERFSLVLDEWTSTTNKRYVNVIVHSFNKYWSLGLIRIHGFMTADVLIEFLKNRLILHDICLENDIVAVVTDTLNITTKVGKLINAEHQFCLAYGIHLAVCDVLYNIRMSQYESCEIKSETVDINDSDNEELDNVDCFESDVTWISQNDFIQDIPDLTSKQNINEIVNKVRKIVIYFKRSPLKNNIVLQKYVKFENGEELPLLLDCRTRWDSLLAMLERFILLRSSIEKALLDLNYPIHLEDCDFALMAEIIDILTPIKLTVDALYRRGSNLCTADAALKFLVNQLAEKNSVLANKMKESLVHHTTQRRRVELSGVLNYLQNPRRAEESEFIGNLFSIPNTVIIRKQIQKLIQRINKIEGEHEKVNSEEIKSEFIDIKPFLQKTLEEKLQEEIERSMKTMESETCDSDLMTIIKKEMNLFENGGVRGRYLELTYRYLLSIPPTSGEPEQPFLAPGYIRNKLKSWLGDDTLDALIFLRSHFQKKEATR